MGRAGLLATLFLAALPARGGPPPPAGALAGIAYGVEPAPSPTVVEQQLSEAVRGRLGGASPSPALALAARELAGHAADGDARALERRWVRAALARAGAADPGPLILTASDALEGLAVTLAAGLPREEFTHYGLGAAARGNRVTAVVLASRQLARFERFPRDVAVGTSALLAGALSGLQDPKVYVTDPSGQVRMLSSAAGARIRAKVAFGMAGRWVVEVLGTGPGGPQVAALLVVSAGGAALEEPERPAPPPDPDDPAAGEEQVLVAVNALRARRGLLALEADPRLREEARRHSARMLAAGELAHILPGGGDLGDRLRQASIPFRRARENLALGPTPLSAQESLEGSPAHLENLLDPEVTRVGVGLARGRRPAGGAGVYVTEIFVQPVDDSSDSHLRPETRVKEVLWAERERLGKPPLLSDPTLDALATRAAGAMLRAGKLGSGNWGEEAQTLLGRRVAAVDSFVASSPSKAARSASLGDPRLHRVGVGVAIGDDPRYGAGQLWIAVIYTD